MVPFPYCSLNSTDAMRSDSATVVDWPSEANDRASQLLTRRMISSRCGPAEENPARTSLLRPFLRLLQKAFSQSSGEPASQCTEGLYSIEAVSPLPLMSP